MDKSIQFQLDPETHKRFKALCANNAQSMDSTIKKLIALALATPRGQKMGLPFDD